MGMYTELIFEGITREILCPQIIELLNYFFSEKIDNLKKFEFELPNHPFFKEGTRWHHLGWMSSYYHLPMSVAQLSSTVWENQYSVFMRCDLKNYENEIENFLDWIKPYMKKFRGWIWYEEWEEPKGFTYHGIE